MRVTVYLSIAETAARLGCSPDTVKRRIAQGLLRAVKGPGPTSPYKVTETSIAEYERHHEVAPAEMPAKYGAK